MNHQVVKPVEFMQTMKKIIHSLCALAAIAGTSTLLGGCDYVTAPEPEPTPTPAPTPAPGFFDPAAYNTKGVELNKAGDEKLPEYYEVTGFDAPDILQIRSVDVKKTGTAPNEKEILTYGAPDRVRLAGIYTPRMDSANASERRYAPLSMQAVRNWTLGRKLTIEQDPRFPVDLQSIRRVQIFFPGGANKDQSLNLNRLLVRSGYAVVDVLEPTVFDTKGWLNDEEYARMNRLGLWKYIVLQNRQQPPIKKTTITVTANANAKVTEPTPAATVP